jgi:acyl-CoA thioesterase-1
MGLLLLNTMKAQDNILILGDSLSAAYKIQPQQSWVYLLQQRLNETYPHYKVVNESTSGHTTANGFNQLNPALQQNNPKIVIVELGANDGLRGLAISHAKKNLEKIIQLSQQKKAQILLLGMRIPPNYGKKYTQAFAKIYTQLAEKYQLLLVPFLLEGIAGNPSLTQADGLHPNAQAQPLILENIWPSLKRLILELEK